MNNPSNKYPPHWGLAGQTLPWGNRLYRKIKNNVFKHQTKGDLRKVLLVAHNIMMLEKMSEIVSIIEDNSSIQWFCTVVTPPDESKELIQEIKKYGYTFIHPYYASIQLWDLIMVASHQATHHFNDSIPTLLVDHGMGDTKVISNSQERYQYARCNVLNKKNKPVYSCVFESSERRKQEAINDIPILKDVISVVGHIEADKVLSMNKSRSGLRSEFGYNNDDIIVFICSSHGDNSLLDSMGHELISEALTLPPNYKFIFASHFLNWQKIDSNEMSISESLLKYESDRMKILRPNEDYLPRVVVSDICLSDFTAASLLFTFLNRPVIFIPFPSGVVSEKSPMWRFYCEAPRVEKIKDLHLMINNLVDYPDEILEFYSSELVTYSGEAKERIKYELYRLLKI